MTITSSVVIYRQFVSLKKIERAWVTVDVKWADTPRVMDGVSSDAGFQDLRHASSIYVRLFIHNGGNTPAWLVAKRIGFTILDEMPKLPNFDKLPPEDSLGGVPLSRGEKKNSIMWLSCDAVYSRKKAAFIYGYVKYTDIFGDIRTTSFGFAVNGGADLKRLNVPGFNITT
jgi:hypothetical protein